MKAWQAGGRPETESEIVTNATAKAATPEEAVELLAKRYDAAVASLRASLEKFLLDGTPPTAAERARFRYPRLRVTYRSEGAPPAKSPRLRQVRYPRRLFDDGDPAQGFSRL